VSFLIISAISLAVFTYIRFGISLEEARRAEVFGTSYKNIQQRLLTWVEKSGSKSTRKKLEGMGVSYSTYFLRSTLAFLVTGIAFGVAAQSLVVFIPAGLFASFINHLYYHRKYMKWRDEILSEVGKLALLLKIRLYVGDTVPEAIPAILPVLHGNMAVEWGRLISQIDGKVPIPDALDRLAARIGDRDMSAILLRLKAYYREGIPVNDKGEPDDPFGKMGENITRSAAKRVKYVTKKLTSPITGLAGVGLVSLVLWIIPYFLKMLQSGFNAF